jgi:hypothetical protein
LGRAGRVRWKVKTSKVVAPIGVGQGLVGWPQRASIERTDHMLEMSVL